MKSLLTIFTFIIIFLSIYFYNKIHDKERLLSKLGYLTHYLGQHEPEISRINLKFKNLPKELKNKKIIHLSDFHGHTEYTLSETLLNKTLKIINKEKPDLILITGDFTQHGDAQATFEIATKLKKLKNAFGVTGDHDCFNNVHIVRNHLEKVGGIKILDNQVLENAIPGLSLIGFGNLRSGLFLPKQTLKNELKYKNNLIIGMSHNPDTAQCLIQEKTCNENVHIDLLLSGHTHGAQLGLPFSDFNIFQFFKNYFGNVLEFIGELIGNDPKVIGHYEWMKGKFEFGESVLYVNRGLGSHKSFRLFCRPEIVVFTFD
eukprot:gene11352-4520_t